MHEDVNDAMIAGVLVHIFSPLCEATVISLRCSIDPQTPGIRGDPVRLKVVLSNLLSNSLKYTPSGGKIAIDVGPTSWNAPARPSSPRGVSAHAPGTTAVRITVTDTGSGIPAEYRELVFEK